MNVGFSSDLLLLFLQRLNLKGKHRKSTCPPTVSIFVVVVAAAIVVVVVSKLPACSVKSLIYNLFILYCFFVYHFREI